MKTFTALVNNDKNQVFHFTVNAINNNEAETLAKANLCYYGEGARLEALKED